jgi:hypothetical protein
MTSPKQPPQLPTFPWLPRATRPTAAVSLVVHRQCVRVRGCQFAVLSLHRCLTSPLADLRAGYRLKGFVSHMGTSTNCGHYVCHLRLADGRWVLFNDEKVTLSSDPPFELGYMFVYETAP